ncbi:MAG: asparaginase domain-containing protein, partial [Pseudomonadales bacterium]|nr:asparaginase domain-containing protein [Pseudomonadales bacterium]
MSEILLLGAVVLVEENLNSGPPDDPNLPEVYILHTGGTIASKVDYVTGAVAARFEPEELLDAVPELANHARIRTKKLGNMWSDDIRTRHWNAMMMAAKEAFDSGAVGVVITHGTDTMHYSAAAAAFAWSGGGGRPPGRIVFTGSQRSSDRGSTDGTENLIAAVHWAAHGPEPTGENGDASVIIMHAGNDDGVCAVLPGCSTRKFHSSKRDAFQGINAQPLGTIAVGRSGECE